MAFFVPRLLATPARQLPHARPAQKGHPERGENRADKHPRKGNDMPKPDENQPTNEPEGNGKGTPAPNDEGTQTPPSDGGLKDKHGEEAINRGRYDRDMKAKDDQIAQLTKQLEEANGKAKSGEDALKKITELEARLEDEKVSNALKLAGCVNEKAAKAVLADYEGDVGKLAEACPYLFGGNAETKQTGSTGAKHHGAPGRDSEDAELDKLFGLK